MVWQHEVNSTTGQLAQPRQFSEEASRGDTPTHAELRNATATSPRQEVKVQIPSPLFWQLQGVPNPSCLPAHVCSIMLQLERDKVQIT